MQINKKLFTFMRDNWKIFIHLYFRTYRFGVNNEWGVNFDSRFGIPIWKRIWWCILVKPLHDNYQMIVFRARVCWFLNEEQNKMLGWLDYFEN